MSETVMGWFNHDRVVASSLAASVLVVLLGVPFRAKSVDPKFIIDVFAYVATIASCVKLLLWVLAAMSGESKEAPTGTDLLLVSGAIFAVIWTSMGGMREAFGDARLPPWLAGLMPKLKPSEERDLGSETPDREAG